jgi:hypothetical protein
MRKATWIAAAGLMAIATTGWAAESGPSTQNTTGNAVGRMQGSPNAAGFGKADTTGTTGTTTGTTGNAPQQDGRMQGSPNAAGFKGGTGAPAGSR